MKHPSVNDKELGPELETNQETADHEEPKPKQPNKTPSNLYQGTKVCCDLQEIVQVPSNKKVHVRLSQPVYNDSMSCMMHLLFSKSVETGTGSSEEQWKQEDKEKEAQSEQIPPKSKPPDQKLQGLSTTCFMLKEFRAEPHIYPAPGSMEKYKSLGKAASGGEAALIQHQEEWLTSSNPIPEKPPDSYPRNPKQQTRGKYNISLSFNVSDLSPFLADDPDLRTNLFQEGGDDMIMAEVAQDKEKEPDGQLVAVEQLVAEEALVIPTDRELSYSTKRLEEYLATWVRAILRLFKPPWFV
ncbi:unnamed protein product [Microthlaspi erraticum]|uniref:Uncharacterized protein n=1 Tax=Microthlaspi erraticum TaxID=1685480 RepID=A0A6D2KSI1_9BRAS|nr:unnamed protein product [Microthlaspi erraticum]CAA7058768.1 unnamed protein product [Microthlaspi erraticum]